MWGGGMGVGGGGGLNLQPLICKVSTLTIQLHSLPKVSQKTTYSKGFATKLQTTSLPNSQQLKQRWSRVALSHS